MDIHIDHVSKKFKENRLFEDVNLTLSDGKIYGFIGRNGSGKSVLFKMIGGYMHSDQGVINVDGKIIGKDTDFPEKMGVLIENPGFMWYETGFENLWYLARIRHCIEKSDVEDTMRLLELDPALKTRVGKYSLGMKQRLGIAQAIMEDPNLLILDEPMNGLDESGVSLIRNVIKKFKQPGKIVLLASHNREDIEILCDEVYRVQNGKVEKI